MEPVTRTDGSRLARSELQVVPVLAALGVLAGVAAKAADESGWRWAADLGSYPAAWLLVVALIGRSAPTPPAAAGRAAAFFAAMTVAYYAWAAWVLGFGWNRLLPVWLVLSATAVAVFAAVVRWACGSTGVLPGAVIALAVGTTVAGGALPDVWSGPAAGPDPLHPVQGVIDVVVALVLLAVLPSTPRARLWAVLLVVPATVVAGRLLDVLRTVIG